MGPKPKTLKVMVIPINLIFKHLQQKTRVAIWLYDESEITIEGIIVGFDEFMNIVIDQAIEVKSNINSKSDQRKERTLGRLLLKGDNISLIAEA